MAKEENTRASACSEEIIQKIREVLERRNMMKYNSEMFNQILKNSCWKLKANMEPFPNIPEPL